MLAGIEAGGTKFICGVADKPNHILDQVVFPTGNPEETLARVLDYFAKYEIDSLGVGSFGPIDTDPDSSNYGYVTSTPKLKWQNYDFLGRLQDKYSCPIAWTTDVNAAAMGEFKLGAGQGLDSLLYLTVGTGIGGGFVYQGQIYQTKGTPEMGHLGLARHPHDSAPGICPFHGACLEGLASGPAIEARAGMKGHLLKADSDEWEIESYYLAQALMTYTLVLRPDRIILGGGVMHQTHLFPLLRSKLRDMLAGYLPIEDYESYIQAPGLKDQAGLIGSLVLADQLASV